MIQADIGKIPWELRLRIFDAESVEFTAALEMMYPVLNEEEARFFFED